MESEPYNLSDTLKTARSKNTLKGKDRDIQRKLAGKLYMNKISMFETNEEEDFDRNDDEILQQKLTKKPIVVKQRLALPNKTAR